jgi:thiamine pyrophosphate-dependent acetolactate synthase large subunit-like protein
MLPEQKKKGVVSMFVSSKKYKALEKRVAALEREAQERRDWWNEQRRSRTPEEEAAETKKEAEQVYRAIQSVFVSKSDTALTEPERPQNSWP